MGHGKIQNIIFEKIKVLYLIDGQLKSTYVFRIFKSWFLWQWQAYEIHLINMGHSKPKLVFSQIWLAHVKLSPKWLIKIILLGHDHIEKFFTIRVPNPPNQYGTKHFNFFFISNFKIDPSHDQVQLWASFKAHWNYPKSASKTHLIEYGTPCIYQLNCSNYFLTYWSSNHPLKLFRIIIDI